MINRDRLVQTFPDLVALTAPRATRRPSPTSIQAPVPVTMELPGRSFENALLWGAALEGETHQAKINQKRHSWLLHALNLKRLKNRKNDHNSKLSIIAAGAHP